MKLSAILQVYTKFIILPEPMLRQKITRAHKMSHSTLFCLIYSTSVWDEASRLIYSDKKENQFFLIYKEIHNLAVAKSYMTNGLLIYGEIFAHILIN